MRGIILGLAAVVAVSGLPLLSATPAHAAGTLHEEYVSGYSGTRTSQNQIKLSGVFKFVEGGTLGINNLICTVTVTMTLAPDGSQKDVWWADGILYSNVKNSTGSSCSIDKSNNFVIKNPSGETLATYNNTTPPRHSIYSFFANTDQINPKGQVGLYIDRNGINIQPNEDDPAYTPIISFDRAPNFNIGAGGGGGLLGSVSSTGVAIQVDNYGTPGTYGMSTFQSWFENVHKVDIKIDTSGASIPPPYISIAADASANNRPELKFILNLGEIEGSIFVSNHKWLLFSGNTVDSKGNLTSIPGLYIVSDDDANNNYFLYAPGVATSDIVASGLNNGGPYVITNPDGSGGSREIPTDEINAVFNYIMDVPKDGTNNCQSGGVYLTGPNSLDGATVPDVKKNHPNVTSADARLLNTDCLDKSSTGWPAKWGLTITDVTGACGLAKLFGNTDVSSAFTGLLVCLYNAVFGKIIDWAAGLVENAAGISYLPRGPGELPDRQRIDLAFKGYEYPLA